MLCCDIEHVNREGEPVAFDAVQQVYLAKPWKYI